MGIFTTWNFDFFEKPEVVLRKRLDGNASHPFVEKASGVFVLTIRPSSFAISAALCVCTVLITAMVYLIRGTVDEYIVFNLIVFFSFFSSAVRDWQARTVVVDSWRAMYEFYKGDRLIYRGHLHNVYIRLKGVSSGGGDTYYSVVLCGYQVDEEPITSSTTQHDRLAKLGRRLAHKLNLNFFDHQDKSRYHVIRHRCPYKDSEEDGKPNQDSYHSSSATTLV